MRIAMIVSGRVARYEVGLLNTLENCKHEIDLFISVNSEDCAYTRKAVERLQPWLKGSYIKPFVVDREFFDTVKPEEWPFSIQLGVPCSCQLVDGKYIPYNAMSMFFNDSNAFRMATEYADENGFEYDCYMKFRSDMVDTFIPDPLQMVDGHLVSNRPICQFLGNGLHRVPVICDAWAWGDRKVMSVYFNTHDFVLDMTKKMDGRYFINFEECITDNIIENQVPYTFVSNRYHLDRNRRIFDKTWTPGCITDTRGTNLPGAMEPIDVSSVETLDDIPAIRQE